MSAYPHGSYTQVAYPTQGYGAPIPPPHAFHPSPMLQPAYHVDPNTFRRDYVARLANLSINSRPIIQSLSMIAQDYSRFAEIVVQCIEQHIRRVPATMKLPAFYLLDAISKNVYEPYARHFRAVVVHLFKDTYDVVDQATRSKMEEMLLTWRTGAPNGRELFGVVPQIAIEGHIWGSTSSSSQNTVRLFPSRRGRGPDRRPRKSGRGGSASTQAVITQARVLSELEFVLGQKERALQSNPYDKASQTHVAVLQQLRTLVQAGVSQKELGEILAQLHNLAASTPTPTPPPPTPQPYIAGPPYVAQPPPAPQAVYPTQPTQSSLPSFDPSSISLILSAAQSAPVPSTSTASAPVPDITNLFNSLVKAGVVSSATGTPTGAGATANAEDIILTDSEGDASQAYRKVLFTHSVKLSNADITRHRPPLAELLYGQIPTQCKQCGIRLPEGSSGKKDFDEHLDMHFRQNRKASQAVGRGHSRSWFVGLEDWVYGESHDIKGKGRADGRSTSSRAAVAQEAAEREAELRAMVVIVPQGDESKTMSCPICKEHLASEFLEEVEEWGWRNAVKRDDKIYHATCHAEAVASKTTLASRLRNESGTRSRSTTPENRRTPPRLNDSMKLEPVSPSRLAGVKRKAEDDRSDSPKRVAT
ncbi:uncharacterized protein BXZ73DRAFT_40385 [Epithele typhae]|uniref:uncharacterized protein n=1 Tax=Epithele typhae TaxID=378194 RepID=UPI0020072D3E|nr:uncharacterized protein BXZ73DRAFT_40385 [Epithele typhae]KAH9943494.1 hypothetical protein BXZ73DRAFT_40385 [Epithele typhae]